MAREVCIGPLPVSAPFKEQSLCCCPVSHTVSADLAIHIAGNKEVAVQCYFYGTVCVFFDKYAVAMQPCHASLTRQGILRKTGCPVKGRSGQPYDAIPDGPVIIDPQVDRAVIALVPDAVGVCPGSIRRIEYPIIGGMCPLDGADLDGELLAALEAVLAFTLLDHSRAAGPCARQDAVGERAGDGAGDVPVGQHLIKTEGAVGLFPAQDADGLSGLGGRIDDLPGDGILLLMTPWPS